MYRKYSTRGGVEWQIHHEVKLSAVFAQDLTQSTVLFRTSRVNGDFYFALGGLAVAVDLERMYIRKQRQ